MGFFRFNITSFLLQLLHNKDRKMGKGKVRRGPDEGVEDEKTGVSFGEKPPNLSPWQRSVVAGFGQRVEFHLKLSEKRRAALLLKPDVPLLRPGEETCRECGSAIGVHLKRCFFCGSSKEERP
ncbi:hypothetical protein KKC87_00275 [Patescibacteria group bacterium]|nr:hypothetical protein [Patescibacteria group bacterium]